MCEHDPHTGEESCHVREVCVILHIPRNYLMLTIGWQEPPFYLVIFKIGEFSVHEASFTSLTWSDPSKQFNR